MLHLVSEEPVGEELVREYFDDLYKIVCVAERPESPDAPSSLIRSTYLVDWEQLVHLLEDYTVFGEDIVEVTAISGDEEHVVRGGLAAGAPLAQA